MAIEDDILALLQTVDGKIDAVTAVVKRQWEGDVTALATGIADSGFGKNTLDLVTDHGMVMVGQDGLVLEYTIANGLLELIAVGLGPLGKAVAKKNAESQFTVVVALGGTTIEKWDLATATLSASNSTFTYLAPGVYDSVNNKVYAIDRVSANVWHFITLDATDLSIIGSPVVLAYTYTNAFPDYRRPVLSADGSVLYAVVYKTDNLSSTLVRINTATGVVTHEVNITALSPNHNNCSSITLFNGSLVVQMDSASAKVFVFDPDTLVLQKTTTFPVGWSEVNNYHPAQSDTALHYFVSRNGATSYGLVVLDLNFDIAQIISYDTSTISSIVENPFYFGAGTGVSAGEYRYIIAGTVGGILTTFVLPGERPASASESTLTTITDLVTDIKDEALGKWVLDPVGNTLTLYRTDGTTVLKTFNLSVVAGAVPAYTTRTPV